MDIKKLKPVATLSAIGVIVLLALAGKFAVQTYTQIDTLKHTVVEQTAKIAKDKKDLDALAQRNADLRASIAGGAQKAQSDSQLLDQLRGSIDAFAKQAASCEGVRQQLSRQGSQS